MHLLVILVAILSVAQADVRVHKEHTTSLPIPSGWSSVGRADARHIARITIAVTQQNKQELERIFWEVSNPKHVNYGKYLTLEQANAIVAPSQESFVALEGWLRTNEIDFEFTYSGDFVIAYAPVSKVETLLQTTFYVYQHTSGQQLVRALAPYSVPASIAPHVDFVGGLTHFPKQARPVRPVQAPFAGVTPPVIKKFFGIPPTTVGTQVNNSQAVAQFLGQYYSPSDLTQYQKTYNLPQQPVTQVLGANNPNNPGIEASLDIQYIMGTAPKVDTWFVYTSGLVKGQEPFLDWITNMTSTPNSPWVHSVSYGDVEASIDDDFKDRCDVEFQKIGVTGRSILYASGDDGTGCKDVCKRFVPNWPSTSPYVTSVGGIVWESATSAYGDSISSGGFSDYFAQPPYQQDAVSAYLKAHPTTPNPSAYNATGRAVPDIASFSENVMVVWSSELTPVGGTSCAAPVISGVITLLNDARIAANKPTLGFLNQFIYQTYAATPDAFIDITSGENAAGCCPHGFSASAGWDPITGVGAPNFPNLLKAALAF